MRSWFALPACFVVVAVALVFCSVAVLPPLEAPVQSDQALRSHEPRDPAAPWRHIVIGSGLLLGVGSAAMTVRRSSARFDGWSASSMALAIWGIGWLCIPIWANRLLSAPEYALVDWLSVHHLAPHRWLGASYQYIALIGTPALALFACLFVGRASYLVATRRPLITVVGALVLPLTLAASARTMLFCLWWVFD